MPIGTFSSIFATRDENAPTAGSRKTMPSSASSRRSTSTRCTSEAARMRSASSDLVQATGPRLPWSAHALTRRQRRAERLEKRAIDRIALRIILGMPLHPERKAARIGDADRLDRAVLRHALDHDPLAGLEDALSVQRIDPDPVAPQDRGKGAAGHEADVMPIREDDHGIGMDLAILEPRHAMVHATG